MWCPQVNKIREVPHHESVLVTHTDSAEVYVWSLERQPNRASDKVGLVPAHHLQCWHVNLRDCLHSCRRFWQWLLYYTQNSHVMTNWSWLVPLLHPHRALVMTAVSKEASVACLTTHRMLGADPCAAAADVGAGSGAGGPHRPGRVRAGRVVGGAPGRQRRPRHQREPVLWHLSSLP